MCINLDSSSEQVIRQDEPARDLLVEVVTEVYEFLKQREQMADKIVEDAQRKAKEIRQQSNQFATEQLQILEGNDQKWLGSVLYWKLGPFILCDAIAEGVGLSRGGAVPHWVFPYMQESICRTCGKPYSYQFTGREDVQRTKHYAGVCDDCQMAALTKRFQLTSAPKPTPAQQGPSQEELRRMPYAEYLQTEHWKSVRADALKRAVYRCQVCNTNQAQLHVHHRTYENRGNELPRDLIVLCENCHRLFHEFGKLDGAA